MGGIPEGFFDDPELDAKARGVEAPSQRAERELEEGLKKFEREMAVEIEHAEETRHELDEEKAEEVLQEEEEFQTSLRDRITLLRKRAIERTKRIQEEEEAAKSVPAEDDSKAEVADTPN